MKETFAAPGFGCRAICDGICRKGLRIGRLHVHVHHVMQDELFSRAQQGAKIPSEGGYFTEKEPGNLQIPNSKFQAPKSSKSQAPEKFQFQVPRTQALRFSNILG